MKYAHEIVSLVALSFLIVISTNYFRNPPFQVYFDTVDGSSLKGRSIIYDPNLGVELISKGLASPTTMAFLGANDILVLEKDNGTVRRITNGNLLDEPVLQVNVANQKERGMLGIAIPNYENGG